MTGIGENLGRVRARIVDACGAAQRPPESVGLIAVSKGFAVADIRQAVAAGQFAFGESYVQEALPKIEQLSDLKLEWHFIGPVQSNKTRDIASHFNWVHGVDRLKIAQRLSDHRPAGLPPLQACVQVNISGEASKSGCKPGDALELCLAVATLPRLHLRGLMSVPAPAQAGENPGTAFRRLRELFGRMRAQGLVLDTISAGMSEDMEAAIAEGVTLLRIGTAIFGERNRQTSE
ncbi:MAG: YggS family pyridoxal phosphate-dependent enzyme [Panacagrimonas sp.]